MTTEIEKQFFECFGIEPKMLCNCEFKNLYDYRIEYGSDVCDKMDSEEEKPCGTCIKGIKAFPLYPEITDRKLLLLFCIANAHSVYGYSDYGGEFLIGTTIEELKENLLKDLIRDESRVRKDIKALFEGVE